jgi:hypothetical protein
MNGDGLGMERPRGRRGDWPEIAWFWSISVMGPARRRVRTDDRALIFFSLANSAMTKQATGRARKGGRFQEVLDGWKAWAKLEEMP